MKNIIIGILLVAVGVLSYLQIKDWRSDYEEKYNPDAIMEQISYLEELSLVKYNYNGTINFKEHLEFMNIEVPLTKKAFFLKYRGYVKAGIDLKNVSVKVDGTKVRVIIPKPKLLETVIDEKSIVVYDERMTPFNPTSVSDYKKSMVKQKEKLKQKAIREGILLESSEQAHRFLSTVLLKMNYENIQIEEPDGTIIPLPKTDK